VCCCECQQYSYNDNTSWVMCAAQVHALRCAKPQTQWLQFETHPKSQHPHTCVSVQLLPQLLDVLCRHLDVVDGHCMVSAGALATCMGEGGVGCGVWWGVWEGDTAGRGRGWVGGRGWGGERGHNRTGARGLGQQGTGGGREGRVVWREGS
jgi:hypothetical protein